jgi:hypothetical protein
MNTFPTKNLVKKCLLISLALAFFLVNPVSASNLRAPGIELNDLSFFQASETLDETKSPLHKVYLRKNDESYQLKINFSLPSLNEEESLIVHHTPSGVSSALSNKDLNGKEYHTSLEIKHADLGENSLLIKRIGSQEDKYSSYFFPYTLDLLENKSTLISLLISTLKEELIIVLLLILIISLYIIIPKRKDLPKVFKVLTTFILLLEFLGLSLFSSQILIKKALESGYLEIEDFSVISTQSTSVERKVNTLTKLDGNGRVTASLATSWSNISPLVWEFSIIETINPGLVVNKIQEKSHIPEIKQLLRSVSQVISTPSGQVQFLMIEADPLLAHKLSQIEISTQVLTEKNKEERNSSSKSTSYDKKTNKTVQIIQSNTEEQKKLITKKEIENIIEPNPGLWPQLFKNDYLVVPAVNSKSISLITNRKKGPFKDSKLVDQLRNILQSGAVLQTSYFQYGQLASQFVSPGVTGYDPDLIIPFSQVSTTALSDVEKERTDPLLFRFPVNEEKLALVIVKEVEKLNIPITGEGYQANELQNILLNEEIDLLLLEYDYILGDVGPFLETFAESSSTFNKFYENTEVDLLIKKARKELNQYERLQMLQKVMNIIVLEDPLGIPLLYKRSFKGIPQNTQKGALLKSLEWLLSL